jgi:hypothetical protein
MKSMNKPEGTMMDIRAAQERYDNQLPDYTVDDHRYDGEIDIKGMVFCYEDGELQQVVVPAEMYMLPHRDREIFLMWAEEEAYTSWLSSQEERSYYDY